VNDTARSGTATEQSAEQSSKKKESRPVPETLSEFLLADKVSPQRFLRVLVKRPQLADDDLVRAHGILTEHPARIGRVAELTRAATQSVPHPTVLLRWCEDVLRAQDESLREWAHDTSQDVRAALDDLLKWAYPQIQSKGNPSARQRAEACLLIGLHLLHARRSLSPLDALRSIASAAPARRDKRRTGSPDRSAGKLVFQANAKQLFELARVVELAETEIALAEEARRSAISLVDRLRLEIETAERARDSLSAEVQDLNRELSLLNSRIAELEADLEGARTRAIQDTSNLKARFRRQGERLARLLADAWDSIDADPPHPAVARERLEIAQEAIREESEWLDRSSD
jgi:hypothetical protein